jgi:hypothetical protein
MILEKSTATLITFLLVDATDDETSETGKSPSVQLSKNGGAFAAATNSPSEIGLGWYKLALTTAETDTEGPLLVDVTAVGADVFRDRYFVFDFAKFKADTSALGTLANQTAIKAKTDLLPASPAAVGDAMTLTVAYDAAKNAASSSTALAIKASTDSIGDLPTAAEVADAVWDEALADHDDAGSAGKGLADAGAGLTAESIADAVWDEDITEHATEDSTGAALAGGVDPNAIADAVWDELIGDHVASGSFGEEVQAHTKSDEFPDETGLADLLADAVWNELLAGHVIGGSSGKALGDLADTDAAAIADAVWDEDLGSHTSGGTFGEKMNDLNPLTVVNQVKRSTGERQVAQVGATYRHTMPGLIIPASWTRMIFVIKKDLAAADESADLYVMVTNPAASEADGTVYVNGREADSEQRLLAALSVNQAGGSTGIYIDETLTALIGEMDARYALKVEWENDGESDETVLDNGVGDFIFEKHATRSPIIG